MGIAVNSWMAQFRARATLVSAVALWVANACTEANGNGLQSPGGTEPPSPGAQPGAGAQGGDTPHAGDGTDTPVTALTSVPGDGARAFVSRDADDSAAWGVRDVDASSLSVPGTGTCGTSAPSEPTAGPRKILAVHVVGGQLLRLGYAAGSPPRAVLERVPLAEAGSADAADTLDLSNLLGDEAQHCPLTYGWGTPIFTSGNYAYLSRHYNYLADPVNVKIEDRLTLYVIDLSDPTSLRVAQSIELEPLADGSNFAGIQQTDHALLVGRSQYYSKETIDQVVPDPNFAFDVFDLADPSAPRLTTRFDVAQYRGGRGGGWGMRSLGSTIDFASGQGLGHYDHRLAQVDGDLLVSQHLEPLDDGTGLVRFYLDRIDLSDPAHPEVLPAINIPGTLVYFRSATGELVTLDYEEGSEPGTEEGDCLHRGAFGSFDYEAGNCHVYYRQLDSLLLDGDEAVRQSQLSLDRSRHVTNLAADDDRIFLTTTEPFPSFDPLTNSYAAAPASPVLLESLRLDTGRLVRQPSVELRTASADDGLYNGPLFALGERALEIYADSLTVVDTRAPLAQTLLTRTIQSREIGAFEVKDDVAYSAFGRQGVAAIDLEDGLVPAPAP